MKGQSTINYVLVILGIGLLTLALPSAMMMWLILPSGRYPVVLVGLPALPLVWLGLICLRRAGVPVEDFVRRRPRMSGVILGVGSLVLILVMFLLAASLGLVD